MEQGLRSDLDDADVDCHICRRELHLIPDSFPLWFRCEANHFLTMTELLDLRLPRGGVTPEALTIWSRRAESLRAQARGALANRHHVAAAGLEDAARQIRERLNSGPVPAAQPS
jgi:hypothetical protein